MSGGATAKGSEGAVRTAQYIVGGLTLGVLAFAAFSGWLPKGSALRFLVFPAGLLGIVSPVVGYRLYHLMLERIPPRAGADERRAVFVRANVLAMGVTEAVAFFGVLVYGVTGEWVALTGLVTHVLLAGAVWPSPERLELFLQPPGPERES
jgi:hypothetical protein